MTELTREVLQRLAEPFPADCIEFKPGATTRDKKKALALAYVEVRHYFDRLNEVVGPDWTDEYQFINPSGELISCGLTICGVTRWDIGEKNSSDINTATSALAQSFKRACVKFGLGRYLYAIESVWVAYDAERKQFTEQSLAQLKRLVSGDAPKKKPKPDPEPETTNGNGLTAEQILAKNKARYIARIHEVNAQLAEPKDIDPTWLTELTENELIGYGQVMRRAVDAEAEQVPDDMVGIE